MRSFTSPAVSSLVGGAALAVVALAPPAEATPISFEYDCVVLSDTVCTPGGGPYGTADALHDGNVLDIGAFRSGASDFGGNAGNPAFTGANGFFLNHSGGVQPGYNFVTANQNDPAGTWGDNVGGVEDFDNKGDGRIGANAHESLFSLLNEPNLLNEPTLLDEPTLFSSAFDPMPTNQSPVDGATVLSANDLFIAAVPEPATLILLGSGLLVAARFGARRARRT